MEVCWQGSWDLERKMLVIWFDLLDFWAVEMMWVGKETGRGLTEKK